MSGTGITDLGVLLGSMEPVLLPDEVVFVTLPDATMSAAVTILGMFREAEGMTIIVPHAEVRRLGAVTHSAPMRQITLTVHSSLEAVGLTAAVATELAAHGISANVIAAFYHDHIFVGAADGERARDLLVDLARRKKVP